MRITKFGHACVRLEHDGGVVVVDPGTFTEASAVDGVGAVLITHEHPDHYHPDHLRATAAPVLTIEAVAARIREDAPDVAKRVEVVTPGQELLVEGLPVRVVGEKHAVIHPELPHFDNSGYVVRLGETRVYHPGDALTLPDEDVDLLCLPVSAPWLKVSECIDFARDVGAPHNLAIHDKVYSEVGLAIVDGHLGRFLDPTGQSYTRLAEGDDLGGQLDG